MSEKLFVVDALSSAAQELGTALSMSRKEDALAMFASRLAFIQAQWGPEQLVVAFDGEKPYRAELWPDYKPWNVIYVDDKLLGFMAEVTDWVQSQGIPFVYDPSFDAADLAATLISQHDGPAVYVSGSHHARQLVESGRVAVLNEMYGDKQGKRVPIFYTWPDLVADVYTLYGKPIEINYEDYLCLVGTRGMLGAPGVGPVTARVLLSKYGTLEGIQEAWPDISIKGKKVGVLVREGLRSLFDRLSIVRNIMLLRRDVPIPEFDRTPPDLRKFSALWPRDANRNQGKTISKPPDGQKEGENDESITDNQEHQKDGAMDRPDERGD
jgi:5'-3' exonuclease